MTTFNASTAFDPFTDDLKPPTIDYDLHGLVGIRLINPSPGDAGALRRQLGAAHGPLQREPDIVIRFEKALATKGMRYVAVNDSGRNDDGFFVLQSNRRPAKVRIAFEQIGKRCEIVCESGLQSVPLLTEIVNLTILKRQHVSLHASAFNYKDKGVIVTGWARCGKTEALLAFLKHGAEFIGDEWIILSGSGQRMYGVPGNFDAWERDVNEIPYLRRQVGFEKRVLFGAIRWLDRVQEKTSILGGFFPARLLRTVMPGLKRQLHVSLSPEKFRNSAHSVGIKPEKLFLLITHNSKKIEIKRTDPLIISRRMISCIRSEQLALTAQYLGYKFAVPGLKNSFIETAHKVQSRILDRALEGKEAYTIWHPYPVSLDRLFEAMKPFVEAGGLKLHQ